MACNIHIVCPTTLVQTCACRLLELSPGQKIADQARQVLTACEKTSTDAVRIEYDPRNPFDICSITFTPIYKGSKFVEDPYTGACCLRLLPCCLSVPPELSS